MTILSENVRICVEIVQVWESGKLNFPDFQIEIWKIQNLGNPKSGKLEFARSGIWEIRFSRFGI